MAIIGHELFSISNAFNAELYKMSNIWRYTSRLIIKPENLAEHSYYVAVNVLRFGHFYKLSQERIDKAIRIALAHDTGEIFTGDIPHNLKVYSPEIKKLSEELEVDLIAKNFPFFEKDFKDFINESDKVITKLVELADVADVIAYINREETLGNKDADILQIRDECNERFIKTKIELEQIIESEIK